jgi:hypothetical protein
MEGSIRLAGRRWPPGRDLIGLGQVGRRCAAEVSAEWAVLKAGGGKPQPPRSPAGGDGLTPKPWANGRGCLCWDSSGP